MREVLVIAGIIGACLCGCDNAATKLDEHDYLRSVLPETLLDKAQLEVASEQSVSILGDGQSQYLGLHVFRGQSKVNRGIRAEVSVDYPFQQGDIIRYSWRFMLPVDFVSDAPRNRWWLIGQWHDQPNSTNGETWDNFESRSPPVLLGLGELDGKLAIGLTCGVTDGDHQQRSVGPAFLERGKWHRIATEVLWSQGSEGEVRVFIDENLDPVMSAKGPNMNNDYQHYLKLGMYRHPAIETDNRIYIDDIEILKVTKP
ncbi:polysaccharide lyase [Allorhodopirellula solitaria]|uniref:Polysaccharide lyase n=1 Tax=Allorhodopirellula solitaria TaxID=2527987 RepID=A0A5C5YHN5_9BACT|nr:polysaccharide lyase [Allorhodopirellula solitaria]TWT73082.1 hypothetical protein CA85_15480 [Allorhodopirellula solitaria]